MAQFFPFCSVAGYILHIFYERKLHVEKTSKRRGTGRQSCQNFNPSFSVSICNTLCGNDLEVAFLRQTISNTSIFLQEGKNKGHTHHCTIFDGSPRSNIVLLEEKRLRGSKGNFWNRCFSYHFQRVDNLWLIELRTPKDTTFSHCSTLGETLTSSA